MEDLTSSSNPKIREVIRLRERRTRDKTGRFLIEGYRELLRASKVELVSLFICPELFLGENERRLIEQCSARIYRCPPELFKKISYRDRPDGLLGVAMQWERTLQDLPRPQNPLYVVAEAIEKPGNLGTILRSCDATGVDGVIVCDRCTDIFNPNTVRASVGTLFTQPVVEANGEETLEWLEGVQILAATPSAKTLYTEVDLTGPIALALGTEQLGLSQRWLDAADLQVRLPMQGSADSLNVAMAATVLLYEAVRQRG